VLLISGRNPQAALTLPVDGYVALAAHMRTISTIQPDPTTLAEAMRAPDAADWKLAMEAEMASLRENQTWILVPTPAGRHPIAGKWVFTRKQDALGVVVRHKARWVAKGFHQVEGRDYGETYAPVARFTTVRLFLALATASQTPITQMDVVTAFLHGRLEEEVLMAQPDGFEARGTEGMCCHLKKAIYGLKQAPRCWYTLLRGRLQEAGYRVSQQDACLFQKRDTKGRHLHLLIYVDDFLFATQSAELEAELLALLNRNFKMKHLGRPTSFLGWSLEQDPKTNDLYISQPGYIQAMLELYGLSEANPSSTPMEPRGDTPMPTMLDPLSRRVSFRQVVGSLLYAACSTRPDIYFAVCCLCRHQESPTALDWLAARRVLLYLKGTPNFGLHMKASSTTATSLSTPSGLAAYSDADWGGDPERKSITGYLAMYAGSPVSWQSKRQPTIAKSTTEAEYMALYSTCTEVLWLRHLLIDLGLPPPGPIQIFEDNTSCIKLAQRPQDQSRTKHIDITYHYIREQLELQHVSLHHITSKDEIADIFTKPLPKPAFIHLRHLMGITSFRGGC
jgi:hypothetical protein